MLDGQAEPFTGDVGPGEDTPDVVLGLLRDRLLVEEDDAEREVPLEAGLPVGDLEGDVEDGRRVLPAGERDEGPVVVVEDVRHALAGEGVDVAAGSEAGKGELGDVAADVLGVDGRPLREPAA